ncbi:MAG TPA: FixH family protein [Chitinophagales bacterium]|nr:FixH family protein [Chitinophagales bacterium]
MKRFLSASFAVLCTVILLGVASCKKDKDTNTTDQYPIPSNLQKIATGYATGAGVKVEAYAAGDLYVGYNKLYIALYDSATGNRLTSANVTITSVMTMMGNMASNGPAESPASQTAEEGLFNGVAVYTMPSGANCSWALNIHVVNAANSNAGDFSQTVSIMQPTLSTEYSIIANDDSSSLVVAMVGPTDPKFGTNNFELAIYRKQGMMGYVPDDSYTVDITPTMPSMGGMSSPNNVNPVSMGNGHYKGSVNFNMSGDWRIMVHLMHNGNMADTAHYFDLYF